MSGKWEEAVDDESAVEMLEESMGRQAGFMATAGALWSELLLLSDASSPPRPTSLPLPAEWPSFKSGLQTFLADHVGMQSPPPPPPPRGTTTDAAAAADHC